VAEIEVLTRCALIRLAQSYDRLLANPDAAEAFEREDLGAIVDRLMNRRCPPGSRARRTPRATTCPNQQDARTNTMARTSFAVAHGSTRKVPLSEPSADATKPLLKSAARPIEPIRNAGQANAYSYVPEPKRLTHLVITQGAGQPPLGVSAFADG